MWSRVCMWGCVYEFHPLSNNINKLPVNKIWLQICYHPRRAHWVAFRWRTGLRLIERVFPTDRHLNVQQCIIKKRVAKEYKSSTEEEREQNAFLTKQRKESFCWKRTLLYWWCGKQMNGTQMNGNYAVVNIIDSTEQNTFLRQIIIVITETSTHM